MQYEEVDLKKVTYLLRLIDGSELLDPFANGKKRKNGFSNMSPLTQHFCLSLDTTRSQQFISIQSGLWKSGLIIQTQQAVGSIQSHGNSHLGFVCP